MDNEKIKELVTQFADELFRSDDMSDLRTIDERHDVWEICNSFASFLMETHCIVEKKELQRMIFDTWNKHSRDTLSALFGKFKVGDKVRIILDEESKIHTVTEVCVNADAVFYKLSCSKLKWFAEFNLEPYTEPETKEL